MKAFISKQSQLVNGIKLPSGLVLISTKEVELIFGITKDQRVLEDTEERYLRDGVILDYISNKLRKAAEKNYSVLIRRHSSIKDDTMALLYRELNHYGFDTVMV